ncbi:Sodium/pantothenate symporter [Botrimarina colliarenosi]|uniref:Sodium/pantothenate symporter n=1 Tax=Botrimarina colliarenosi TaxID=2528001 RepID=A0A5C6AGC4_9BACT|nr:sodium:solute symporter family protein [Botrimarina colliarenosi]TWT98111.1 Sodium/pantothenate symporter [Botrimarina colliarenosi]
MLPAFVAAYLLISIGIGAIAARRVNNTTDFALAGRSLPLAVVIATTFATWFGSETVLGVPSKFVEGGVDETLPDPWGTSMALILVGMFLARPLYRMTLLTIGDFYRVRYGRAVETIASVSIAISYIGWVAAQVTAMGLVFSLLMGDWIDHQQGMILGTAVVLVYTVLGGMWSVALTDFIQMGLIIIGLAAIAWIAGDMAGGAGAVVSHASEMGLLEWKLPESGKDQLFLLSAVLTLMLGSIPQQDVFQRVMCAKNEQVASWGPIIGGLSYLAFSTLPMFIVVASLMVMPERSEELLQQDSQLVLPTFVIEHMNDALKVLFFGALLSAIMSTASATILAPSTILVQNIFKELWPGMTDRQELRLMRLTVFAVAVCVLVFALWKEGTPIYELVESAYEATIVAAFVPLVWGVYWKRATPRGGLWSAILGLAVWMFFLATPYFMERPLAEEFPGVLAGLVAAILGMIVGSLADKSPLTVNAEATS